MDSNPAISAILIIPRFTNKFPSCQYKNNLLQVSMKKKLSCPKCNSELVQDITYGYPTPEALEDKSFFSSKVHALEL